MKAVKAAGMAGYHPGNRTRSSEKLFLIQVIPWKMIITLNRECFGKHKRLELANVELHFQQLFF